MDEKEKVEKNGKKGLSKLIVTGGIIFLLIIFAAVFVIGYTMIGGKNNEERTTLGPIFESEEYTVNLLNAGGRRFLRTQFTVEVDNKKAVNEIHTKMPIFNHIILRVLGNLTLQDLELPGAKDKIGAQLTGALNDILDEGQVTNIFFGVFVWQ